MKIIARLTHRLTMRAVLFYLLILSEASTAALSPDKASTIKEITSNTEISDTIDRNTSLRIKHAKLEGIPSADDVSSYDLLCHQIKNDTYKFPNEDSTSKLNIQVALENPSEKAIQPNQMAVIKATHDFKGCSLLQLSDGVTLKNIIIDMSEFNLDKPDIAPIQLSGQLIFDNCYYIPPATSSGDKTSKMFYIIQLNETAADTSVEKFSALEIEDEKETGGYTKPPSSPVRDIINTFSSRGSTAPKGRKFNVVQPADSLHQNANRRQANSGSASNTPLSSVNQSLTTGSLKTSQGKWTTVKPPGHLHPQAARTPAHAPINTQLIQQSFDDHSTQELSKITESVTQQHKSNEDAVNLDKWQSPDQSKSTIFKEEKRRDPGDSSFLDDFQRP